MSCNANVVHSDPAPNGYLWALLWLRSDTIECRGLDETATKHTIDMTSQCSLARSKSRRRHKAPESQVRLAEMFGKPTKVCKKLVEFSHKYRLYSLLLKPPVLRTEHIHVWLSVQLQYMPLMAGMQLLAATQRKPRRTKLCAALSSRCVSPTPVAGLRSKK